ncbi:MAG: SDR family NAD(P)-dependent oxidoreductase, partial [Actinobacteria bacterium]|nr:SDR family NAD(P)-dependent oxidoreductase [Actinomycetota bacterium]
METGLAAKRAFISGSTEGIGFAIARSLLRQGASVVINGRHEERVERSVAALASAVPGADVSGIAADFGKPAEVARLIE